MGISRRRVAHMPSLDSGGDLEIHTPAIESDKLSTRRTYVPRFNWYSCSRLDSLVIVGLL